MFEDSKFSIIGNTLLNEKLIFLSEKFNKKRRNQIIILSKILGLWQNQPQP